MTMAEEVSISMGSGLTPRPGPGRWGCRGVSPARMARKAGPIEGSARCSREVPILLWSLEVGITVTVGCVAWRGRVTGCSPVGIRRPTAEGKVRGRGAGDGAKPGRGWAAQGHGGRQGRQRGGNWRPREVGPGRGGARLLPGGCARGSGMLPMRGCRRHMGQRAPGRSAVRRPGTRTPTGAECGKGVAPAEAKPCGQERSRGGRCRWLWRHDLRWRATLEGPEAWQTAWLLGLVRLVRLVRL